MLTDVFGGILTWIKDCSFPIFEAEWNPFLFGNCGWLISQNNGFLTQVLAFITGSLFSLGFVRVDASLYSEYDTWLKFWVILLEFEVGEKIRSKRH